MKKKLITLLAVISLLSASLCTFGFSTVNADAIDSADLCFLQNIEMDISDFVSYSREPLYDSALEQNGWQYEFSAGEINGYALMTLIEVNGQQLYEMEELKYSQISPFADCNGVPVYITHKKYIEYSGNRYVDLTTGEEISSESIEYYSYMGFRYSNSSDIFSDYYNIDQTITYARKTTEEYSIQYDLPSYQGQSGQSNCANIAGAVAIGYYDRFYENLIPDYKVYLKIGSIFRYRMTNENIINVVSSLHSLMSTDVGGLGTTFTGFQTGMQQYVNGRGLTYSSQDMFSWGSLDISKFSTAVRAGKPVALFLSKYAIVNAIETEGSTDIISNTCSDVAHVAMACGYKIDTYYDANNRVIDTKKYLKVAVGIENLVDHIAYLNLSNLTTLDHAVAITIQ